MEAFWEEIDDLCSQFNIEDLHKIGVPREIVHRLRQGFEEPHAEPVVAHRRKARKDRK
ncbi:MAG: hypothetical protein ACT6UT_08975 [Allorhizobium sp.]|uniref:hypothetical protein n=1 Tax=Allorhizobium sp. TaxID=633478 RepID=UPI004033A7B2